MKTNRLPHGFLSMQENGSYEAIKMFMIYLKALPKGWDEKKLNDNAVKAVRDEFGVNYGFETMIKWGLSINPAKSHTSWKTHVAMSRALHDAKGLIAKGYYISPKKIAA